MVHKKIIVLCAFMLLGGKNVLAMDVESNTTESAQSDLLVGIKSDDIAKMEAALKRGADINGQKNEQEPTPVIWALQNGRINALQYLLEHGADPRKRAMKTYHDNTRIMLVPLQYIATDINNDVQMAELLIKYGADVDEEDILKDTTLCDAAWYNNVAIVQCLLKSGKVKVNHRGCNGLTPLSHSIRGFGRTELVKILVANGGDVNAVDDEGLTPLMHAVRKTRDKQSLWQSHESVIKAIVYYLLQTGKVNIDQKDNAGKTALVHALENYNFDMVKILLERGANKGIPTGEDTTLLGNFDCFRMPRIIQTLVAYGINVNVADKSGKTLLMHAAKEDKKTDEAYFVAEYLLESGKVVINQQDKQGRTALMYAAIAGNKTMVLLFLKFGANLTLTDHHGKTAGQYATEWNNLHSLKD
jgi:ankyrin repeat protein